MRMMACALPFILPAVTRPGQLSVASTYGRGHSAGCGVATGRSPVRKTFRR